MIDAPVGLRIRAFEADRDIPHVVRVINAENEADNVQERDNEAEWRAHTAHVSEQFDPSRDLAVAEVEGRVVAVAGQDWVDTRDGAYREHRLWGCVEPGFRRRGIGAAMLRDNERRAATLAAKTGAPMLPVACRRLPDDRFRARGLPLIHCAGTDPIEIQRATQLLADELGQVLAEDPGQWYMFRAVWPTTDADRARAREALEAARRGEDWTKITG